MELHLQSQTDGKQTRHLELPKWELSLGTRPVTMANTN